MSTKKRKKNRDDIVITTHHSHSGLRGPSTSSNVASARFQTVRITRGGRIGQSEKFRRIEVDDPVAHTPYDDGASSNVLDMDDHRPSGDIGGSRDGDGGGKEGGTGDGDGDAETLKKKRQRTRPLDDWIPFRQGFLDELIRGDGRGENRSHICARCDVEGQAMYRCLDCFGVPMLCKECLVLMHQFEPFHTVEAWTSAGFWQKTLLSMIGLVVNLGHSGFECPHPSSPTCLTVLHVNGLHSVNVTFCGCAIDITGDPRYIQLLRARWYPASQSQPATAFTMAVLDLFHLTTVQGKLSAHDFYTAVVRMRDNIGRNTKLNQYHEFLRAARSYRHLVMLKRAGRGHDPSGVDATRPGQLALDCPACPHPGKNLPDGWEDSPREKLWLYTMYLAMDANFRLKLKDRGVSKDVELGPGWAYFVDDKMYKEELPKHTTMVEKSTCQSTHQAIARATSRVNKGYAVTGVGSVVCSRNGLVRGNGVADLQKGERYANMDYVFLSSLIGTMIAWLFVSYDIACQWHKNLCSRINNFPSFMQLDLATIFMQVGIPKFHIAAHSDKCRSLFCLNFRRWWARTDGEGIERGWAHINPVAMSTREMGPGFRHDTLDDHWAAWNWYLIISLGIRLLQKLKDAHHFARAQADTLAALSAAFPSMNVETWKREMNDWQDNPSSHPDPFSEPSSSKLMNEVQEELKREETDSIVEDDGEVVDATATAFLVRGIQIEQQQRALTLAVQTSRPTTRSRTGKGSTLSDKRGILYRRIKKYRRSRIRYMPPVAADSGSRENEQCERDSPELIPLHLPSSLSVAERASLVDTHHLVDKERRLRIAQAEDCLAELRRLLRLRTSLYSQKKAVAVGQRENTRANSVLAGFNGKIARVADRYRVAHDALQSLDPDGEWSAHLKPLREEDIRGPDNTGDTRPVRLPRNARVRPSEGRRKFTWIWLNSRIQSLFESIDGETVDTSISAPVPTQTANDPNFDVANSVTLKVEFCKAYARAERWREELELVQEEMRRTLAYCEWKSNWWEAQTRQRTRVTPSVADGISAYASKQAAIWEDLGELFASKWRPYFLKQGLSHSWPVRYASPIVCEPGPANSDTPTNSTISPLNTPAMDPSRATLPVSGIERVSLVSPAGADGDEDEDGDNNFEDQDDQDGEVDDDDEDEDNEDEPITIDLDDLDLDDDGTYDDIDD